MDSPGSDPWGTPDRVLDNDLVHLLRKGPVPGRDDLEVASALARLVHDELERYGTAGDQQLTDFQAREAILALRSVLKRVGIDEFDIPFSDFGSFRTYWVRNGAHGSWQGRREMLQALFDPLHNQLAERENRAIESTLAEPVTPHTTTGWYRVDAEITELRRHFAIARTPQDHRNVGNDCVAVLEALSAQVYNRAIHLREDEEEPKVSDTKKRFDRYIEVSLSGSQNELIRKLARAAIEVAQKVKHNPTSSRRDAGIASDAVILLANMFRRLAEPS